MKTLWLTLIVLLTSSLSLQAQVKHTVTLSGLNEIPEVRTPAMGFMEVWVESDTLYVSGDFSDLKGTFLSASVQFAEEGRPGNNLFSLNADLSEDKKSGSIDPEKNKFHLPSSIQESLQEGNLYLNITSSEHRHGEIRGKIPDL